jgi:hypothetical protein
MAELLGSRLFTALDTTGRPISGAHLRFFLTGTTTPVTVYQNATLVTPHPTPVPCDAAGRAPDIYFSGSAVLKMTIADAADVPIRTIDPFNTVASAGTLAFLQDGAGAVSRTALAKMQETVSTADFGILSDDATDNAAALALLDTYLRTFTRPPIVIWLCGRIRASVWPNFAQNGAVHIAHGRVELINTGATHTLKLDGTAINAGGVVRMQFGEAGNPFIIKGGAASLDGVYCQGIHHSVISARVMGAGTTYAGLRSKWCVCTDFHVSITSSYDNLFAWYNEPTYGIVVDTDGVNGPTTACRFWGLVERLSSAGRIGVNAVGSSQNNFYLGTVEICRMGIYLGPYNGVSNPGNNTFWGVDLEQNTTYDVTDEGNGNRFLQCTSSLTVIWTYNSFRGGWIGGQLNSINFTDNAGSEAQETFIANCAIRAVGGAITNAGIKTMWSNVYDGTAAKWKTNTASPAGSARTVVSAAYSAAITLDASLGDIQEITVTNNTAFTINAPTNPYQGQELTITIRNNSGGAMGVITWNAAFRMTAWTNPANAFERAVTFYYSPGGAWIQKAATGGDVALG